MEKYFTSYDKEISICYVNDKVDIDLYLYSMNEAVHVNWKMYDYNNNLHKNLSFRERVKNVEFALYG